MNIYIYIYGYVWKWGIPSGELSHSNGKIHHAINGKIHYFYGHFPLQTVSSPEGTPNEIAIFRRDNDQQNHWV